jgi:hypothetical protein
MGQVGLQDPNNLGQAPLSNPKFLRSEGDVKLKLIIIITIIIIDFTLQIKFIFFYSNNIYFKFNDINESNNIKLVWPKFL